MLEGEVKKERVFYLGEFAPSFLFNLYLFITYIIIYIFTLKNHAKLLFRAQGTYLPLLRLFQA